MKRKFLLTTVSWVFIQLITASNALADTTVASPLNGSNIVSAVSTVGSTSPGGRVIFSNLAAPTSSISLGSSPSSYSFPVTLDGTTVSSGNLWLDGGGSNSLSPGASGSGGLTLIGIDLTNSPITIASGKMLNIYGSATGTNANAINGVITTNGSPITIGSTAYTPNSSTVVIGGSSANVLTSSPINVNVGTLKAVGTSPLGSTPPSGNITVAPGATLELAATTLTATTGNLVNNGNVRIDDAGSAQTWGVANISGSGNIYLGNNYTFTATPTASSTYAGNITGPGTFAHAGGVTLTLSGNNQMTNSGGFSVSAASGVLVGNTNSLSGALTFVGNTPTASTIQFDQSTNGTYNGTFVSNALNTSATIRKTGTGTVTLGADNFNSAFTGTLEIDNGAITLAPNVRLPAATKLYLSSPTASLNIGASNNTITSLSGLSGGSTVPSVGNINLTNSNGSLTLNTASGTSFGGTISGPGNFINANTGMLTLNGTAQNFVGGTLTVTAGSVSGNTSNIGGNAVITGNGNLDFNQANNGTFYGSIMGNGTGLSGTGGGLTKEGAGNLTLAGNVNGFTGTTIISGGTLTLNSNYASNIANGAGASVIFNGGAANTTYGGVGSGAGYFQKMGTGTLTMSAAQTGTGTLEVSQGILVANGLASGSTVNIDSGALLLSGGALGNVTTAAPANAGSFAGTLGLLPSTTTTPTNVTAASYTGNGNLGLRLGAGNGISEFLTVSGASTFNAGSYLILYPMNGQTYAVGNSFQLIRGTGTVGSTSNLRVLSGGAGMYQYTLGATGGTLTATISKITPLSSIATGNPGLANVLSNANIAEGSGLDVLLLTARESAIGAYSAVNTIVTDLGGGNRDVAIGVPSVTNSNAKIASIATKSMSSTSMSLGMKNLLALNRSNGVELEEVNNLVALSNRKIAEEISYAKKESKIGYRSESNKQKIHRNMTMSDTMWVQGVFDRYLQTSSVNNTGYGASTGGIVVGTNFATSNSEKASVYGGFSNTSLKFRLNKGKTIINNYIVGVAMMNDDARTPLTYGANFGLARYKDKRTDTNGLTTPSNSRHNAYNVGAHVNLGKNYHEGNLLIKPSLGLELLSQFHKSYTETGGAISNSVSSKTIVTLDVKPGVEMTKVNKHRNTSLMKKVGLSYIYTANLSSNKYNRTIVSGSLPFTTSSSVTGRHALELDLSLVARNKDADFSLQYQGTLRNKGQNHMFGLGVEWKLNNDI